MEVGMSETYSELTEENNGTAPIKKTGGVYMPSEGQIIDQRYQLVRKIGEGGMGYVYLAQQLNISRKVVVKLLKPEFCISDEQISRFKREAELASKLSHPNCVTIHDFGFDNDAPYIAMEYLEGMPLSDLLFYREDMLSLKEITGIISQVCDALEVARCLEVVHRDLKPENIFVLNEPQGGINVKVLDFGIAKLAHTHPDASNSNLTRGDMVFGTPQYMAPEQIRGKPLDHRADVYALTVILFEMIAGKVPFNSEDPADLVTILTHHLRDPVPKITPERVHPRTISMLDDVNRLIQHGMAKKPELRLKTTKDLKNSLVEVVSISDQESELESLVVIPNIEQSTEQIVARPSLLFSTLDVPAHEGNNTSHITVDDLLPQSTDPGHIIQESSLSFGSSSQDKDTVQKNSDHYDLPFIETHDLVDQPRTRSFFGSLFKLCILLAMMLVLLAVALTFPNSPLNSQAWRSSLPSQVVKVISEIEANSQPILSPLYDLFLTSSSQDSPVEPASLPKPIPIPITIPTPPLVKETVDPAQVNKSTLGHDQKQDELLQKKPQTVSVSKPTSLSSIGVLVIQTNRDCDLSITQSDSKPLKAGDKKRVPVRFGSHHITCIDQHKNECNKSLQVSEKRKYKVQCDFTKH